MRSFTAECAGRFILINLERGDLLLESITAELSRLGVKDAVLTGAIGALSKVSLHRVTSFQPVPEEEFITIEQPMELSSLQGMVINGHAHFHIVASDLKQTYTGHLEPGTTVLYLAEISLLELKDPNLARVPDENKIGKMRTKH